MARNITFAPEEYYHLYNRGTEKRNIFISGADYERFLVLLYLCNGDITVTLREQGKTLREVEHVTRGTPLIDICFYCLMPNHFHIYCRELTENGISKFMQKISTGYTMYFNQKRERTGALLQGKFKARHINEDTYARYLISYTHLNPIKLIDPLWKENGIRDRRAAERFLSQYQYSSFLDYAGENRVEKIILNKNAAPEYFESPGDFKTCTKEWLSYKPE